MTITTAPSSIGVPAAASRSGRSEVTLARAINSEWIKLRTLRSTLFTLGLAVVFVIGLGILVPAVRANDFNAHGGPPPGFDAVVASLRGVYLAQLPIAVLGVMMITGEYGTGMIRATLSAIPKRLPVLWAKMVVFCAVVFVLGTVASLVAFEIGQSFFAGAGIHVGLGSPGAARAIIGGGLYLTLVGLLGMGLGFLIRNTAGALSTLFGLLLVIPPILSFLPQSWYDATWRYTPMIAGLQILTTHQDSGVLHPWNGIGVLALWVVGAIAAGAVMLKRHDA